VRFWPFLDFHVPLASKHLDLSISVLDEHQVHRALLIDHLEQIVPLLLNEANGDGASILIDHHAFHAVGSVIRG